MAQPRFDPKYLSLVTAYDGNPTELQNFITSAQALIDIFADEIPPGQVQTVNNKLLILGLRSKLTGRASEVIQIYQPSSWDDYKNCLRQNFGDNRDEISLMKDLNNLKQGNLSSKKFYEEITHIANLLCGKVVNNPDRLQFYQNSALFVFLSGLNEPLGSTLRAMQPQNLAEAHQYLMQEQSALKFQKEDRSFNNKLKVDNVQNQKHDFAYISRHKFSGNGRATYPQNQRDRAIPHNPNNVRSNHPSTSFNNGFHGNRFTQNQGYRRPNNVFYNSNPTNNANNVASRRSEEPMEVDRSFRSRIFNMTDTNVGDGTEEQAINFIQEENFREEAEYRSST